MAYEILVVDIDGTLVTTDKVISPKTREKLIEVQEAGIKVVIASGRSPMGIMHLAKEIRLDDFGGYVLAYNGGRITNCQTGELIYNVSLPTDVIPEIYEFSQKHGTGIMTYRNNMIMAANQSDEYIDFDGDACHIPVFVSHNFVEDITEPINKFLLTGKPELLAELEPIAVKQFENRLSVYRSEGFYLETMPLGIDKAYGLSRLLKHLGLERRQMICLGDGFNDISMLQFAGLGVAMDNASDQVKAAADYITRSCDEDGVVHVIERYLRY